MGWVQKLFGVEPEPEPTYICIHDFKEKGKVFHDTRTIFKNECDIVRAIRICKCERCGLVKEDIVLTKYFPVYKSFEWKRRDAFIEKLKSRGYQDFDDFVLDYYEEDTQ